MKKFLAFILLIIFFTSCEKEIDLDIDPVEPKLVVYGIIENGLPPYVILTESLDFFEQIDSATVAESFVEGAKVTYTVDGETFNMEQFEINQNGFELIAYFPTPADSFEIFGTKIPIYDSLQFGQLGKTYDLRIEVNDKVITSTTTIPFDTLSLYNFEFNPHPDNSKDSLVSLSCSYDDPPEFGNFGRLLTQVNQEPLLPDRFQSVYTDELINGGTWDNFVIPKGENSNTDFNQETYSYFNRGDTVTVKWCAIDKTHYDFWITIETDRNNSGNIFGRPTVVKSNIEGGLGIWGGYAATYYTVMAPE